MSVIQTWTGNWNILGKCLKSVHLRQLIQFGHFSATQTIFWILQVSSLREGDKVFENVLPDETIGPRPVSIFQAPLFLQFRFYHIDYFNLIMFILESYYYVHELDLQ